MTDEKIPYIQCLYHTGKKVYKYWLAGLALIGIIIGLYFIIVSQWKQICNLLTAIENFFDFRFNIIWSFICTVPWYWWVAIGVIAGPFILVAIWCALKHFNIDAIDILIWCVSAIAVCGFINFILKCATTGFNISDCEWLMFTCLYLFFVFFIIGGSDDRGMYL